MEVVAPSVVTAAPFVLYPHFNLLQELLLHLDRSS
jgi:hypothetical protein